MYTRLRQRMKEGCAAVAFQVNCFAYHAISHRHLERERQRLSRACCTGGGGSFAGKRSDLVIAKVCVCAWGRAQDTSLWICKAYWKGTLKQMPSLVPWRRAQFVDARLG